MVIKKILISFLFFVTTIFLPYEYFWLFISEAIRRSKKNLPVPKKLTTAQRTHCLCMSDKVEYVVLQRFLNLGWPLFIPEADFVDCPEEVLPLCPGDTLLPQQFQHRRPHCWPFLLKSDGPFVLDGKINN